MSGKQTGPTLDPRKLDILYSSDPLEELSDPVRPRYQRQERALRRRSERSETQTAHEKPSRLGEAAKLAGVATLATAAIVVAVKHGGNKQDIWHNQNTPGHIQHHH